MNILLSYLEFCFLEMLSLLDKILYVFLPSNHPTPAFVYQPREVTFKTLHKVLGWTIFLLDAQ